MKNVTVSRTKSGKYFISIQVEMEIPEPERIGGRVGIDLGVRDFVSLSTGEKVETPQYYRKAERRRRRLARQLSRKKKGSRNREKARLRLACLDERIANQRSDFQHKLSRQLIEENQFIGLEDLNVRGMMANHHLAKSIGDAGWSGFVTMLNYKGEWYGCQVEKIDRWYPSTRTCSRCGKKVERMSLQTREWRCAECGQEHDRDINAAINILKRSTVGATGSYAWGQHVRPGSAPADGQRWTNQEANLL
jgi:putative transposase